MTFVARAVPVGKHGSIVNYLEIVDENAGDVAFAAAVNIPITILRAALSNLHQAGWDDGYEQGQADAREAIDPAEDLVSDAEAWDDGIPAPPEPKMGDRGYVMRRDDQGNNRLVYDLDAWGKIAANQGNAHV
jgi:hypothetical protein